MAKIEEKAAKILCEPSPKTQRTKEKLQREFAKQDKQITPEAIQATLEKIYKWIADHNDIRVPIKKATLQLFANNQSAANISKAVEKLLLNLKNSSF